MISNTKSPINNNNNNKKSNKIQLINPSQLKLVPGYSYLKVHLPIDQSLILGNDINFSSDLHKLQQQLSNDKIILKPLRRLYEKNYRPQFFTFIQPTKSIKFKQPNKQIQNLYINYNSLHKIIQDHSLFHRIIHKMEHMKQLLIKMVKLKCLRQMIQYLYMKRQINIFGVQNKFGKSLQLKYGHVQKADIIISLTIINHSNQSNHLLQTIGNITTYNETLLNSQPNMPTK